MEDKKSVREWKEEVQPVLESKLSEWKVIGYSGISKEELWGCLEERVWKRNEMKRLHEIVQDIFHLSITEFMNYTTIDTLQIEELDLKASIHAVMNQNEEDVDDREKERN